MRAKAKRIIVRILVVFVAVVTLALLVRAVFNFTTGKTLEKYLATAKTEGVALKMRELVPDCPDADNGAVLWKAAESLVLIEAEERQPLVKAAEILFNGQAFDETSKKMLARLVERNRKMLEIMAEAAAKPCFVYKDWHEPAYVGRMINALPMIQGTRIAALDAVLRADRGDLLGALGQCRMGMGFTRKALSDASSLISCLVALADMKIDLIALNHVMSGREVDPAVLAAWIQELDPKPWRARFARGREGERALAVEVILDIINGEPDPFESTTSFGRLVSRISAWLIRPVLRSELIWVKNYWDKLQDIVSDDYYRVRENLKQLSLEAAHPPWYFRLAGGLLPDVHSAIMKEATLEAMMLATRTGLACKIYKARTGRYPTGLEALVPDILPEVPIDPFTGKPLVYKIENGELLVYSLGSNEKDDGGRGTYLFTQLVMEKDDDWTWREKTSR
jgi:hypothetical protein